MLFDLEKYKQIQEENTENPDAAITWWLVNELGKKVDDLNHMASTILQLKNAIKTIALTLGIECSQKFDEHYYMGQVAQKVLEWQEYRTLVDKFFRGKFSPETVSLSAMETLLNRHGWILEFEGREWIQYKKFLDGIRCTVTLKKDVGYTFIVAVNKMSRIEQIPIMKLQFELAEIYQNELGRTTKEAE